MGRYDKVVINSFVELLKYSVNGTFFEQVITNYINPKYLRRDGENLTSRVPFLFVESEQLDHRSYRLFCKTNHLDEFGREFKYLIGLDDKRIISIPKEKDFLDPIVENINVDIDDSDIKNYVRDIAKGLKNNANHICLLIDSFNNRKNTDYPWTHIDCFGIVDNDCGVHGRYQCENLAITVTHDIETLLFKHFFPDYISSLRLSSEKNIQVVSLLSNILCFSSLQGLLQSTSIELESEQNIHFDDEIRGVLIKITGTYFKNLSSKEYVPVELFEAKLKNSISSCCSEASIPYRDAIWVREFLSKYEIKKANNAEWTTVDVIKQAITEWVTKGYDNCSNETKIVMDKVLYYSNGHILYNQIIIGFKNSLTLSNIPRNENDLGEKLKEYIKDERASFRKDAPISTFESYQRQPLNHYYIEY